MSTKSGFAHRASRPFALLIPIALISAMFGGGSASAQTSTTNAEPAAVNISLDGSTVGLLGGAFAPEALPLTLVAASSPVGVVGSQPVALGAPTDAPVVLGNPIGDFFGGVVNTIVKYGKCVPVTPILLPLQLSNGDCIKAVQSVVGSAVGKVATEAMTQIFRAINFATLNLAVWWVDFIVGSLLGGGTDTPGPATDYQHGAAAPLLNSAFFQTQFTMSQTVAFYLLVPLFMLVVIQSIAKGSLFFLVRAFTIMLPCAILGGYFVVEFARRLLWITDDICQVLASSMAGAEGMKGHLQLVLATYSNGDFGFYELFWFVLAGFAAIAIWLELLFRQMGVYLAAFFLPLAFAGLVWPTTAKFTRRMVELLIALIFSKVVIVGTLSLGFAAMGFPTTDPVANGGSPGASGQVQQGAQAGGLANGLVSSATLDNLANPNTAAAPEAQTESIPGTIANGAPEELGIKTGSVALDGSDQNAGSALFNSFIVGVVMSCFAIFAGMKLMEFAPGMDHISGARLGNPGNILNRGHVAAFGLGRIGQMLNNKKANIAPHGQNPQNNGNTRPGPTNANPQTALPSGPSGQSGANAPKALTGGPSGGTNAPAVPTQPAGGGGSNAGQGQSGTRTGGSQGRSNAGKQAPTAVAPPTVNPAMDNGQVLTEAGTPLGKGAQANTTPSSGARPMPGGARPMPGGGSKPSGGGGSKPAGGGSKPSGGAGQK